MKRIENDYFYEYLKKYDPDSKYHFAGEVDYHLLLDDKPYEGMKSHREVLHFVFEQRQNANYLFYHAFIRRRKR